MTNETLLRKNERCVKFALALLIVMNQHVVQISICLPLEVYEYADTKNQRTGETIEKQVQKAMELMQTVEMLLNDVKTSGF